MGKENTRKNFSTRVIEEVFEDQGRACGKCGRSLIDGFEAHHINGDNSDNSKENCLLLCASCHDSEKWNTLQEQKKAVIGELTTLIQKAVDGQIAGALMEKTLDAIKMKLSLQKQTADMPLLEAPATSRVEYSKEIAEYNIKEWMRGTREGFILGVEWIQGKQEPTTTYSKCKKKE